MPQAPSGQRMLSDGWVGQPWGLGEWGGGSGQVTISSTCPPPKDRLQKPSGDHLLFKRDRLLIKSSFQPQVRVCKSACPSTPPPTPTLCWGCHPLSALLLHTSLPTCGPTWRPSGFSVTSRAGGLQGCQPGQPRGRWFTETQPSLPRPPTAGNVLISCLAWGGLLPGGYSESAIKN